VVQLGEVAGEGSEHVPFCPGRSADDAFVVFVGVDRLEDPVGGSGPGRNSRVARVEPVEGLRLLSAMVSDLPFSGCPFWSVLGTFRSRNRWASPRIVETFSMMVWSPARWQVLAGADVVVGEFFYGDHLIAAGAVSSWAEAPTRS